MTIKQAVKKITKDWKNLRAAQITSFGYSSSPKSDAVWCAKSDIADTYEVDEEWIGVSPQGNIVWAYASGCSCWGGEYDENRKPTMKEVTLEHKHTPEEWEAAIVRFAETKTMQQLPSYNRYE